MRVKHRRIQQHTQEKIIQGRLIHGKSAKFYTKLTSIKILQQKTGSNLQIIHTKKQVIWPTTNIINLVLTPKLNFVRQGLTSIHQSAKNKPVSSTQ